MGVFIGNLQPGTTTSDLLDFMGDHDGMTDIEIVKRRSEQGEEVRFGHVLFRSQGDATRAIKLQQKKDLHGSMVLVREYIYRADDERRSVGLQIISQEEMDRREIDRRYS